MDGDGLDRYQQKRDFTRTPEPTGGRADGGDPLFVVQRHDARRLHYDFRLQVGDALRSFAVPRGLPDDPDLRHLAVQTEDHPLDYVAFEGVIPKGEYGAGTMTIVDRGTYRLVEPENWERAMADGKIGVVLAGRRYRGEWHFVRTKRAGEEGRRQNEWLLLKIRDRYARGEDDPFPDVDLFAATEAALPDPVEPMRPAATAEPFSDADWLFEMRFTGRRVIAHVEPDGVRLVAADGTDTAAALPAVVRDLGRLRAERATLDGVLVALDEYGRPSREAFDAAIEAAPVRGQSITLQAFDLLHTDGLDLRALPLRDRKALLRATIPSLPTVCAADAVAAGGEAFCATVARAGLNAVIAKRAASAYSSGASTDWREIPVAPDAKAASMNLDAAIGRPGKRPLRHGRVRFTNLDKVFWPDTGETKGDLIAYYERIAPFLLPHLADRPLHMNRFPDGITGKNFYQRKANEQFPEWVDTVAARGDRDREAEEHPVCGSIETLLWLANLGSIDLHPWMSRRPNLDHPDFAVIDLDPKDAPFAHVIRIAKTLGTLLRAVDVPAYPKTSGASGMHIVIPLAPGYTYEQSRMFCEVLARFAVRAHRDIATVERSVGSRGGKVYVDYLQNAKGQTVVPAYVVRPVPGATVSTPLAWDEVTSDLHPSHFTIHDVPARVDERGDLHRPVLDPGIDLLEAIAALQREIDTV